MVNEDEGATARKTKAGGRPHRRPPQRHKVDARPVSGLGRDGAGVKTPNHPFFTFPLLAVAIEEPGGPYRCGGSAGIAPASRFTRGCGHLTAAV